MKRAHILHIDCTDIIGHRVAHHPDGAEQLVRAITTHLPATSRLVLNLGGVPSFSPVFIRAFWNGLAQSMPPKELRERLHLRTSSHTLREAFEHGLDRISRRSTCPHFHIPLAKSI